MLPHTVYPHQRMKDSQLKPAKKEFSVNISGKTAHVCSAVGKAGHRKPLTLDIGNLQVLPGGKIVAGPDGAVALTA